MAYADKARVGNDVRDIRDTKGRALIAPIEDSETVSKAYAVGNFFIHDDGLYRVTVAIAKDGAINIGVNCVETTVMEELARG